MSCHWLTIIRIFLRDLRHKKKTAKPDLSQLELLNIKIHETCDLSGLENICIIEEFLNNGIRRQIPNCLLTSFPPNLPADLFSKFIAILLGEWISGISQHVVDGVQIKRKAIRLRIPNDTYSRGVYVGMTALFGQQTESEHLYISLTIRREHQTDTQITSSELYALFSMAVKQASRQPQVDLVEVRMLVVYSKWVQVVTAKTTRRYITSIVEGWENIADNMEIYQTPWLNFMDVLGQKCVLLATFEAIRLEIPATKALRDMVPSAQNWKTLKHKLPIANEYCNKNKKTKHEHNVPTCITNPPEIRKMRWHNEPTMSYDEPETTCTITI